MTLVQQLARFARDVDVPEEVRASVRRRVLDIIGISLAARALDTSDAVIDVARAQGGAPQATAIGVTERLPAANAALVNGTLAHSLDYDDTHLPSILHPSAPVVPAVLAAAQQHDASGADAVRAIAVGLEICVRLGMAGYDRAAGNSVFFERGQHATASCGAIAGAAAAAAVGGADADGIADAMGIACSMASGILEANRAGGTVKRVHCGWAAHSAVTAAQFARAGLTGPPTVLEGRFGFFEAYTGGIVAPDAITDGLGARWAVPGIFFKPYPANHFTHAGIDAALALRARGIATNDIERITLGVATATVRTIGEPLDAKRAPSTGYQAQFSGPFMVAAALLGGSGLGIGLDDVTDERAHDPRARALAATVTVVADPDCDAIYPEQFPAVLSVTMRDGTTQVERVMTNRGGPQRPLTDDELERKFTDNARRALGDDEVAAIADAAKRLDALASVDELLAPTSKES